MAKSEYFTHEGVTINAGEMASKTFEEVLKEAKEMRDANKDGAPVMFSNWGNKADEKLREAYDIALEKTGKAPVKTTKPAGSGGNGSQA